MLEILELVFMLFANLADIFLAIALGFKTKEEQIDYKIKKLKKEEWFLKIYKEHSSLFENNSKVRDFIYKAKINKIRKDRTTKQDFEIQLGFILKEQTR